MATIAWQPKMNKLWKRVEEEEEEASRVAPQGGSASEFMKELRGEEPPPSPPIKPPTSPWLPQTAGELFNLPFKISGQALAAPQLVTQRLVKTVSEIAEGMKEAGFDPNSEEDLYKYMAKEGRLIKYPAEFLAGAIPSSPLYEEAYKELPELQRLGYELPAWAMLPAASAIGARAALLARGGKAATVAAKALKPVAVAEALPAKAMGKIAEKLAN